MSRQRSFIREKLLELIVVRPGLSITELSLKLGLAKSTVSQLVSALEAEGLVKRVRRGPLVLVYPSTAPPKPQRSGDSVRIAIIRAAEYPHVVRLASRLREEGFNVEIKVYGNGLEATFDLARGVVDAAVTPMPTQILYGILVDHVKILGGGVSGGSYVVRVVGSRRPTVLYTTRASTMELCAKLAGIDVEWDKTVYVSSGSEIVEAVMAGRAGYVAVWEPYASIVRSRSSVVVECGELGITSCCTLAVNTLKVNDKLAKTLSRLYAESLEAIWRGGPSETEVRAYASLVGIPVQTLRKTLKSYRLEAVEPDPSTAERLLVKAGLGFPSTASLRRVFVEFNY